MVIEMVIRTKRTRKANSRLSTENRKIVNRCHDISCNEILRQDRFKPSPLCSITMKVKKRTKYTSGICNICGEWCDMITEEHARKHGFKNADDMAKAGVVSG